jgi:hypothetical protein
MCAPFQRDVAALVARHRVVREIIDDQQVNNASSTITASRELRSDAV